MDNNYNQQPNPYMNNGYGNYGGPYNYGGNPESQKAPNIFQQFYLSFIPSQYNRLTKVTTGSMIGFVTLLAFISTVIIFSFLFIVFKAINIREWINQMPDFEISEGQLYIEEDFLWDDEILYIHMTDDVSAFSYDDAAELAREGYWNIVLIGRDRWSFMQQGQYWQINFEDSESDMVINNEVVADITIYVMRVFFIMGFVIFFVGRVFWYFLCAALYYLLFALLIAPIMKKQLSAGTMFRAAVYSKVVMFVAATFFGVISFTSFWIFLRIAVTIIFMGFAIIKLPDENWR